MTEPSAPADSPAQSPDPSPAPTPGAPVDDRRADPPPPAAATSGSNAPETEGQRETEETVRSISRLEESN